MEQNKLQWTFIKDSGKKYIITSSGKVFSAYTADYILPQRNKQGVLYYRLKIGGHMKCISLNTLLKEHFRRYVYD